MASMFAERRRWRDGLREVNGDVYGIGEYTISRFAPFRDEFCVGEYVCS